MKLLIVKLDGPFYMSPPGVNATNTREGHACVSINHFNLTSITSKNAVFSEKKAKSSSLTKSIIISETEGPGGWGGGGGYSQKNWVGLCGLLLRTLILFMTKICNIPYPSYDLTKNSKVYLWPDPYIKILFQTCIIISSLVQTNVKLP